MLTGTAWIDGRVGNGRRRKYIEEYNNNKMDKKQITLLTSRFRFSISFAFSYRSDAVSVRPLGLRLKKNCETDTKIYISLSPKHGFVCKSQKDSVV